MNGDAMARTVTVNGERKPWRAQSVGALLAESGLAADRGGIAVALNGSVVPRGEWESTDVRPDDKVEIVHIVRGG